VEVDRIFKYTKQLSRIESYPSEINKSYRRFRISCRFFVTENFFLGINSVDIDANAISIIMPTTTRYYRHLKPEFIIIKSLLSVKIGNDDI
jgi:hypothetical protein